MKLTSKRQIESIFRQATSYKDPEDQGKSSFFTNNKHGFFCEDAFKQPKETFNEQESYPPRFLLTGWSIHEVFDKENASEKDLNKTTDDALIAPPGTKNSSAALP